MRKLLFFGFLCLVPFLLASAGSGGSNAGVDGLAAQMALSTPCGCQPCPPVLGLPDAGADNGSSDGGAGNDNLLFRPILSFGNQNVVGNVTFAIAPANPSAGTISIAGVLDNGKVAYSGGRPSSFVSFNKVGLIPRARVQFEYLNINAALSRIAVYRYNRAQLREELYWDLQLNLQRPGLMVDERNWYNILQAIVPAEFPNSILLFLDMSATPIPLVFRL